MRRAIIVVAVLMLGAGSAKAQSRLSAGAAIDAECRRQAGQLVVPSGMKAVRLRAELHSSWLPCAGAGHATQIGFRILSPTGAELGQLTNSYGAAAGGAGDLAALELAPGIYAIEMTDGGKLTNATVTYELIPAKQPTAATMPAEARATAARGAPKTIGGEWRDPEVGSRAVITQTGGTIAIVNRFVWQKKQVEWRGQGSFDGQVARFTYAYTTAPPPGWKNGTMELTLVGDNLLRGFWTTEDKTYTRNITLLLVKPDRKPPPEAKPAPAAKPATPAAPATPGKVDMTGSGGKAEKEER